MGKKRMVFNTTDTKVKTKEQAYEIFEITKKGENLSEKTTNAYKFAWDLFIKFCEHECIQEKNLIELEDIDDITISKFNVYLCNYTNANDVTRATYIKNLKVVLKFFIKKGYIENFEIIVPNYVTPIQETYTNLELQLLLKKPKTSECAEYDFIEHRNWVIICYLVDTFNRARTVINLKIKDIDFEYQRIMLQSVKNKNPYTIPLSDNLADILREYLKMRKGKPEDYLFCTIYGEPLTYHGLRSAIERYNKNRGVERTGIHRFRHTGAKLYIQNGGREFKLQKMLGHSTLEMSKKYVSLYGDDLQDDFETRSPLGKFKNTVNKKKIV